MSRHTLSDWRAEFSKLDTCAWPGPRPLEGSDIHLLCGRDQTISDFLNEVESFPITFLTGYSGVGKTSLLQRGLVPMLKSRGYVVAICRDWSGAGAETDVVSFLSNRVSAALEGTVAGLPGDGSVMRTLAQKYGDRAVLVLDQFEELIRDARGFTGKLFEALASLVKFSKIRIIISLRMEQLHELRPLEHLLPPFSTTYVYLEEVDDKFIPDVIDAGNASARQLFRREAIDPDVAKTIKDTWDRARQEDELVAETPPGLLALQALLHVLDAKAGDVPVSTAVYEQLLKDLGIEAVTADQCACLFARALSESAEVKLQRCREASDAVGLDIYLVEGATSVLRRTVPHLTSAGYKLVRNVAELAGLAMEDELVALRRGAAASRSAGDDDGDGAITPDQERVMFDTILATVVGGERLGKGDGGSARLDVLTATSQEFARAADQIGDTTATPWLQRFHPNASPFDADPEEVTSGPLMGRPPAIAMIEEYRRFALAMEWLRFSHLVRFSTPMTGIIMVALIHDGFGEALKRWAEEQAELPAGPLHALTASGGQFVWRTREGAFRPEFDREAGEGGQGRLVVNLRWRGASFVRSGFRGVQFVNCDLRGALFARCQFDGVSFVNCLLDGAMFSDCRISGPPSPRPTSYSDGATPFLIARSQGIAAQIAHYRPDRTGPVLMSDLPGFPAVPAVADQDVGGKGVEELDVEPGSLVIRGGRTASLSVRKAQFDPGASFCLRDSAGSGFDVIEHSSEARYEISGCVLRHVTFTTVPHSEETVEPIYIDVWGSGLYQAWMGVALKGSFTASDCTLLSVWNGSPRKSFLATATGGSRYHGLVAVDPDPSCVALVPDEHRREVADLDGPTDGRLVAMSLLMDYRRSISDELPTAPGQGSHGSGA